MILIEVAFPIQEMPGTTRIVTARLEKRGNPGGRAQ